MRAAFVFLMILSAASAASSAWAEPVCTVAGVSGEARSAGKLLAKGDGLAEGAEIRTGAKGRVRLRCVDGSSLVLGDNSQLTLTRYAAAAGEQPRTVALWLEVGVMGQKVTPGGANGSWEVRTPSAVTAVRGTEFVVEVNAEQTTAVHVDTGEVAVDSTAKTRSLKHRPPAKLDAKTNGTQCTASAGCAEASAWTPDRVKALADRLAGV